MNKTIKHGPFLWVRRDSGDAESWDVELPRDLGLTFFCVKNYGGEPQASDGFTGWRLVSGGPLTNIGGWATREAAIADVTPLPHRSLCTGGACENSGRATGS